MSGISQDIGNVRNTFSSWDSCMSKAYCKWPVIAGIIIASLIVLSVLWCIGSCLCCGATLCGSCLQCITCCGCCGACKGGNNGGGGGGRSRHKDDYSSMPPSAYNGYQPQPAAMTYQPPSNGPQFATFDAPTKRVHEDSLPAMPSWDTARTRRVEDHNQQPTGFTSDMEMGTISTGAHAATAATVPQPARSPQPMRSPQPQPPLLRTRGGGYNQVPTGPLSPVSPSSEYSRFEGQGSTYNPDIGAQRLVQHQQQQTGYPDEHYSTLSAAPTYRSRPQQQTGYPDEHNSVLSAAPTYRSRPQQQTGYPDEHYSVLSAAPTYQTVASAPHRNPYNQGTTSPAAESIPEYELPQHHSQPSRDHAWTPLPIAQHDDTDYSAYRRSLSPVEPESSPYEHTAHHESGLRPPSFLQIGRKPVRNSQREV